MFEEGSACKFEIPVEIRSRDQLQGAMTAVIEMQFQRIAGARFGEELEGGLLSKDLSDEIERFFKLVKMMKDINDNREFLNIQVEAKGNAGVINRLFGSMIEHPQQPAIEQVSSAEILDAEVVEDEADQ
jgi:hypothetical protein